MNAFELFAKLGLNTDDYDRGLDDAEARGEEAGGRIGGAIAGGARLAAGALVAGIGAAATGVATLTAASVNAYGEYEQLTGGIEKLYEDASDALMAHASEAYATAGMDANTYMQSVTSFSAALINGLDGDVEAAAEIADMAMRDLADNANTFGTMTVEDLTGVYSALAKGQFQTLDNLNLGYAGTQEGMLQLINDAGIFEEEITSLDDVSFDQMLLAIHNVQEQFNITGTTANEASGTIQGSIGMLQAAWQNLVIGLGDSEADLSSLIGNVVDAARTAVGNIVPVASQALGGIAQLIQEVAPMISEELPGLVDQVLPPLLSAAVEIVSALVSALPSILSAITSVIPQLINTLVPALLSMIPNLILAGTQLLEGLLEGFAENADLIMGAITEVINVIATEVLTPDNIETMLQLALTLIEAVAGAILENAPLILESVATILVNVLQAVVQFIPDLLGDVGGLIVNLGDLVADGLHALFGDWLAYFLSFFVELNQKLTQALITFGSILLDGLNTLLQPAADLIADGLDFWITLFSNGFNNIKGTIEGVLNGVLGLFGDTFDNIKNTVTDAVNFLLDVFDFEWRLPEIQLPHFTVSGGEAPWGFAGQGTMPNISVSWYKKAYDQPMLLNDPTIFGYAGGKMLGGGDGAGGELIVGWDQLINRLSEASQPVIHVHNYIGGTEVEDYVIDLMQKAEFAAGGRG